jgi:hypothetical protein
MTTEPNRIPGAHWARLSDWHAAQAAPHMRRRNMNAMPRIEAVLDYEEFEAIARKHGLWPEHTATTYRRYLDDAQQAAKRAAAAVLEGAVQTALMHQREDDYAGEWFACVGVHE